MVFQYSPIKICGVTLILKQNKLKAEYDPHPPAVTFSFRWDPAAGQIAAITKSSVATVLWLIRIEKKITSAL